MMAEEIARRLRQERERRCMTQEQVAKHIGTTAQNVSRWERSKTTPDFYYRQKLCELFDQTAEGLGFFSEGKDPQSLVSDQADQDQGGSISEQEQGEDLMGPTSRSIQPERQDQDGAKPEAHLSTQEKLNALPLPSWLNSFLSPDQKRPRRLFLTGAVLLGGVSLGGIITWFARSKKTQSPSFPTGGLRPSRETPTLLPPGTTLSTYRGHQHAVLTVAWSPRPGGWFLASGGGSNTGELFVWDASKGIARTLHTYQGHVDTVNGVMWSPNSMYLVSGSDDTTAKIWNVSSGQLLLTYKGHSNAVLSVAWSPNGTQIASASQDQTVQVWDASTKHLLLTCPTSSWVTGVTWSPNGKRLASANYDGHVVQVWDASTGHLVLTCQGHSGQVRAVAWSHDGTRIASGSEDRTVKVWDTRSGHLLLTCLGHTDVIYSVAWSPDDTRIASGSEDQTAKVWDARNGQLLYTYNGHDPHPVRSVAWSPEGTCIASAGYDHTAKVWVAAPLP